MWLQPSKAQTGSVTILALLAMLILGVSTGLYVMSAGAGIGSRENYGDGIAAQYAAESGVIYVLAHAKNNTDKDTGIWTTLPKTTMPLDDTANSPSFTVTVKLLEKELKEPDDTIFKGKYYKITSIGKAGNITRSVEAYMTIPATDPPSPITTFDLMKDADYSGSKWTMNNSNPKKPFASAPADEYYQVLFKDTIDANKGFNLNYNVNLVSTNPGHPNDAGYGIYYLANGNADNMTAYVLQYDPGLSPDQILVKKVIASKNSTTKPWYNEVFGGGTQSFQGSTSNAPKWNRTPVVDSNGMKTYTIDRNRIDPTNGPSEDLMTIPMSTVLNQLNSLRINNTTNNKMTGQTHRLTINARPDNGEIVHTISIDGLEILTFIDRGNNGKPLTTGSTGLRVWQANAQFYNNTNGFADANQVGSIKIRSWNVERTN